MSAQSGGVSCRGLARQKSRCVGVSRGLYSTLCPALIITCLLLQARALFDLPDRVVVSHGTEEDPILNYGNAVTLRLWEMSFEQLTSTPSRQTAEPMLREKRQALLDQVRGITCHMSQRPSASHQLRCLPSWHRGLREGLGQCMTEATLQPCSHAHMAVRHRPDLVGVVVQVREKGYVSDYSGVRISSTGRRFAISNVTIWEVYDAQGVRRGQAATFDAWEWL